MKLLFFLLILCISNIVNSEENLPKKSKINLNLEPDFELKNNYFVKNPEEQKYFYDIESQSIERGFYEDGQEWQRKQCYKIPNQDDSEECLKKTNINYDDYKYKIKEINK